MASRPLARIPVPPGPAGIAALVEPLKRALDGTGPAIAPIPTVSASTSGEYVEQLLRATRPGQASAPLESDEIAVVLATSGSTQDPKGVLHSAETLTALSRAALGGTGAHAQWIAALPVTSIGGLNVLIRALECELDPIAVASIAGAGPFTPEAFLTAFAQAREMSEDVRVSLVAPQLRRLLGDGQARSALQECSQILIGGGPLPLATAEAARAADIVLTTTYGATETAGGCVFNGQPLPGVGVSIDPRDAQILLSGPMVALGYRCEPELTARRLADGIFRTGDTGGFGSVLSVTGRLDDVVTVNGVNVGIHAVEDILSAAIEIRSCAVIVMDDAHGESQLHAAVTLASESADIADLKAKLRAMIRDALGVAAEPRSFAVLEHLPMLANGKIDRRALRESINDGVTWQR